jgi:hypothetical protein
VVSFTPRPLYPWGKSSRYPSVKRLDGPQNRSVPNMCGGMNSGLLQDPIPGIAESYSDWVRAGRSGSDSRRGLGIFLFDTVSRAALGPTQPPIQWVPGAPSLGPGHEADHPLPSSAEVIECLELYTSSPLVRLHGVELS